MKIKDVAPLSIVKLAEDILGIPNVPAGDKYWPLPVKDLHALSTAILDAYNTIKQQVDYSKDYSEPYSGHELHEEWLKKYTK